MQFVRRHERKEHVREKKYMGIERSTFIIDEKGVLVKEYRNVKAASHVNDLLRDLQ